MTTDIRTEIVEALNDQSRDALGDVLGAIRAWYYRDIRDWAEDAAANILSDVDPGTTLDDLTEAIDDAADTTADGCWWTISGARSAPSRARSSRIRSATAPWRSAVASPPAAWPRSTWSSSAPDADWPPSMTQVSGSTAP